MTNTKPGVSSLLALLIPLVAFAPLAGSAGPMFGSAHKAVHQTGKVTQQAQSRAPRPGTFLTGWPFTGDLTGHDLDALTRSHGYFFSSSGQTLDAKGGAHADPIPRLEKMLGSGSNSMLGLANEDRGVGNGGHWDDGTSRLFTGHTLADERIALDSIAQDLCGRAIAPKASGKLDANKAFSDACNGITGVDSGPTEVVGLAVQNFNVPEPSTGLLLLAVGLIGVGTRMKSTFRAPSGSVQLPTAG